MAGYLVKQTALNAFDIKLFRFSRFLLLLHLGNGTLCRFQRVINFWFCRFT